MDVVLDDYVAYIETSYVKPDYDCDKKEPNGAVLASFALILPQRALNTRLAYGETAEM